MNAFKRNCLKIAGFSILIGIILAGIGFSMDNSILSHMNINYDFSERNRDAKSADVDHVTVLNENGNYDFSESYKDVESIDLDISYGTVTIKEGDSFHIEATNMPEDRLNSTIEDGVWLVSDNYINNEDKNDNELTIFGFDIPLGTWTTGTSVDSTNIVLTIPKDFVAENLKIKIDAGTMKADNLTAEEADIHVSAGYCRMNNLTVENESFFSVNAGELNIDNINANNVNMECGVGNLVATGIISGDSYVKNDIGNIDLNMNGREENYNYSVDCGIGTVIINENRYSGVNSKTTKNDDAENSFTLDCGIGKITLKIN